MRTCINCGAETPGRARRCPGCHLLHRRAQHRDWMRQRRAGPSLDSARDVPDAAWLEWLHLERIYWELLGPRANLTSCLSEFS